MVKRFTLFLVFCLMVLPLAAQKKFTIESFEMDPFDTSAQNPEFEKIDGSGDRYAIIKVTSKEGKDDLNAYHFNFGYMNSFVEPHEKSLWVYVQKYAKHVTVSREGFETIEKYDLHTTIQSGKTYRMVLSPASVSSSSSSLQQQMVMFDIQPKDARAVVMVASEGGAEDLFGSQDETGAIAKVLPFGTYSYKVRSEMYDMSEGRFTLNDLSKIHQEQVVLFPNFSTVTLRATSGADIYINGIKKGTESWTGNLKVGRYQIECRQDKHRSTSQTISVPVNQEVSFNLQAPEPIVGVLMVTSIPLGADILIDGINRGKTPMNIVDVLVGKHELKLQKEDYRLAQQSVEVKENNISNVHLELKKIETEEHTIAQKSNVEEDGLWVDLGLSVLWASHNVGANKPEEYGDYFAWGEIKPKEEYTMKNCLTYEREWSDFSGDARYDAATANWGAGSRMPTKAELEELIDNTTTLWTTRNGIKGRLVTSKKNGKSIFLPAAGYRNGTSLYYARESGYYLSSTPLWDRGYKLAYYLRFYCDGFVWYWDSRNYGHSVRPVREKKKGMLNLFDPLDLLISGI